MRKVSDLLSFSAIRQVQQHSSAVPAQDESASGESNSSLSGFADLGARIGEENESLRNLLLDTEHQFGAIHELEDTFRKLVQPLHTVLTTLEQQKAINSSLNGSLATLRFSHEQLHREFL